MPTRAFRRRPPAALLAIGLSLAPSVGRSQSPAGQQPALLPEPVVAALARELSGALAMRNLEMVAREHRTRGSSGWHRLADQFREQLLAAGLVDARIEQFPADGSRFYGTQRSRPPWDAEFAELWELARDGTGWSRRTRLASWEAMPITLAQDSESGEVTADLVDVGTGTGEGDYAGKDVAGRLVLAAAQPRDVARLAVERFGAAGIVSYARNQRTAWWGDDPTLVRWGHLDTFAARPTFAFMISPAEAGRFRERLTRGEAVRLQATVRAGQRAGPFEVLTATIPGADPVLREQEIVFSCHLDHQRPGANDNASGCVAILEVARALSRLITEGTIARPARTLRFVWPPEIEGTVILLNGRPEIAAGARAAIHMDMVGGGPVTKAVFHVTRGPRSLPSFIDDVAAAFGDFVNRQSAEFAGTGSAAYPLVAEHGGKEALQADFAEFTMGSDHEVYTEGSFRIPAIYLNDWPDRYIHTHLDAPANIDPTKLLRAAFIGAASGYLLAGFGPGDVERVQRLVRAASLRRTAALLERRAQWPAAEADVLVRAHFAYERGVVTSIERFAPLAPADRQSAETFLAGLERLTGPVPPAPPATDAGAIVYRRRPEPRGPMSVFGYDYLAARWGGPPLRLLQYTGTRGAGSEYAYEVLNFVDGRRSTQEIRDLVSAEYGPVPLDLVAEYLAALESIGILDRAAASR
jgi:hypothetical protein